MAPSGRSIDRKIKTSRRLYSGKQKAHTVKNNVITARRGKVLYLSDTYEGKKHDKQIADVKGYRFPPGSELLQTLVFKDISLMR